MSGGVEGVEMTSSQEVFGYLGLPILGESNNAKGMVILREILYFSTLFGLVHCIGGAIGWSTG